MKLMCNVEVINRQLTGTSVSSRGKSQQSCLIIAKQSSKDDNFFLILKTKQNSQGIKYKVNDNIENVFTKFISEGKTTIRIKEPSVDLIIKCKNLIELKGFLHTLKLGLDKKLNSSIPILSEINTKNNISTPKKKIVIKSKADYPTLAGFPRTTEELYICNLDRKSFDRQILRLQSLRILNISDNFIKSLPKELASLPNLTELHAANNHLNQSTDLKWNWLNGPIKNTLKLLDLSKNNLSHLSKIIRKLKKLVTLNLSNNNIIELPSCIGSLSQLKYFDISHNKLESLPGSMKLLHLDQLNVNGNFKTFPVLTQQNGFSVQTLTEIGARLVVDKRFAYDASIIPFTLVEYLDDAQFCVCGRSCFDTYIRKKIFMNLNSISCVVMTDSSGNFDTVFDCIFCSSKCVTQFTRSNY